MNAKNYIEYKTLQRKLKKNLDLDRRLFLAGVADHLTEDEKSNFNLVLSKMEQLSNNIKVEEDKLRKPTHKLRKQIFEAFLSYHSNTSFVHMRSQTKMDCLMFFHSGTIFRFKVDLYHSF